MNLEFKQMQSTDQIGKLEKLVVSRLHALREFDRTRDNRGKRLMEKICDRRLSAIVIDLHTSDIRELIPLLLEKLLKAASQFRCDLER